MVHRNQRSRSKSTKRHMNEQAQEPEERSPLKEPKLRVVVQGSGHNEQIHVRVVSQENQKAHRDEEFGIPLRIPRKQNIKWNRKIQEEHADERHLVLCEHPRDVVGHLLWNVGIPDEQELREPQVAPQHADAEHHLAMSCMWLSLTSLKYPFERNQSKHTVAKMSMLTHIPLKVYHPNNVENQCVSMDMIQSQANVELNTAKNTKKTALLRYIL
jgi:hypothetical protein